jgi:hypothetical protein
MKFLIGFFSLLVIALTLNSCNEEVNLTGDFRETVVVHGLLDKADSIHFVKINRAFIGPGNSYDIAQIPDSSYFENIEVTITEILNGSQARVWTLTDTLVENKNPNGVFFAPEQKLYYFHTINQAPLNDDAIYRLNVSVNDGEIEVTGETEIVSGISSPASSQNFSFKFADNPSSYISTGVTASNVGNSYVMNATLRVKFKEYIGGTGTEKTFDWALGEASVIPNSNKTFTANGQTFYNLVKANVTDNPLIEARTFESITVVLTGGEEELYNYMTVNQPSSSLAQSKPTYTNLTITGDARVIGIFSSRQTASWERPFYVNAGLPYIRSIDKKSTRELCTGSITGALLFCSQHISDQGETWHCN